MKHYKDAFTLIELLVVIAIIALLLAIIVPSLKLAKEKAQFIICKTNLRSYGLTMKLYINDNDGKYPTDCFNAMWAGNKGGSNGLPSVPLNCQWHDARISPDNNPGFAGPLWQYMDSQKAHICPTFKKFAKVHGPDHPGHIPAIPIEPQYAYSMNVFLGTNTRGVTKETQVSNPGETLVWVEETIWLIDDWAGWVLNDTCFFSRHHLDTVGWGDFIATYHNTSTAKPDEGKGNAVFVDGHVALLDPYHTVDLTGGGQARAGFIYSWPLRGKYSPTKPY